jgi:hypothetical protein
MKLCKHCNNPFQPACGRQRYCSRDCAAASANVKARARRQERGSGWREEQLGPLYFKTPRELRQYLGTPTPSVTRRAASLAEAGDAVYVPIRDEALTGSHGARCATYSRSVGVSE